MDCAQKSEPCVLGTANVYIGSMINILDLLDLLLLVRVSVVTSGAVGLRQKYGGHAHKHRVVTELRTLCAKP